MESEDVVDPVVAIRAAAENEPNVKKYRKLLDECTTRVRSRPGTAETCEEEMVDYIEHLRHFISKDLFKHLV
ncbi:hypothetical protein GJ496_007027 [Pomphorhynchus laevis]|nr:hypothetical protein GJ496_007027 [Pomphorhynchus laevis]